MTTSARNNPRRGQAPNAKIATRNSKLVAEFCAAYGLAPEQISFDGAEPIFDFDALNILANMLARVPDITVGLQKFHDGGRDRIAESFCQMTLNGRMTRKFPGVAMIGETMHDGRVITGEIQAINVSRARALRCGLRAIGFDPVKFHEARKAGQAVELLGRTDEEAEKNVIVQIHLFAGPRGCNFIKKNGDRTEYENLLASYFKGRTSSKDLTPEERAQWLGMLRAWARKEQAA
jgi:hypothetical protein